MSDVGAIVGLTVASCAGVGLVAAVALHLGRRRSLHVQLVAAVLVQALAVVAAVVVNVQFMFLSGHDSGVILLAVGIASALAVVTSWALQRRAVRALRHLDEGLRRLVDEAGSSGPTDVDADGVPPVLPRDFALVAAELAGTRRSLAELRVREQAAERSRRELISFLSHDLRTPLANLTALTEALEDDVVADVPRALAHLRSTTDRMTGLVDDLFALSRVEVPDAPRPRVPVSLTEVLNDVVSELDGAATARAVDVQVDVPVGDRLAVLGRADDLTRAVANLVVNAVRHTTSGGAVRVEGRRDVEGRVVVGVVDTCGGIPAGDLERVFDVGWRGSPERDDRSGAGLGLAIARGVVQAHGGRIAVANVVGGCRFELAMPAAQAIRPRSP